MGEREIRAPWSGSVPADYKRGAAGRGAAHFLRRFRIQLQNGETRLTMPHLRYFPLRKECRPFQWINVLAVVGALHVASSDSASVEAERQEKAEAQKEMETAWYQKLMKEKEKQEWSELNGLL